MSTQYRATVPAQVSPGHLRDYVDYLARRLKPDFALDGDQVLINEDAVSALREMEFITGEADASGSSMVLWVQGVPAAMDIVQP